ncbi:MAG: hypothetical protein QOD77_1765 [Thermoplasmata archaeon]|jgi:predicted transcriptional regulator|nr:hypothetical protein [Thermoplasmata archaeon]
MRARIRAAVASRPGITKNELCSLLGVRWATIQHHVRVLTRQRLLHVEDRGWSHELFPGEVPAHDRPWLRALHDEDAARVLEALLAHPMSGVYRISDDIGFTRKVVRAHLTRMIEDGVVEKVGVTRPRYRPLLPPEHIVGTTRRDRHLEDDERLGLD